MANGSPMTSDISLITLRTHDMRMFWFEFFQFFPRDIFSFQPYSHSMLQVTTFLPCFPGHLFLLIFLLVTGNSFLFAYVDSSSSLNPLNINFPRLISCIFLFRYLLSFSGDLIQSVGLTNIYMPKMSEYTSPFYTYFLNPNSCFQLFTQHLNLEVKWMNQNWSLDLAP